MSVTRCPECQTTFRVTPEQLQARAGKVRCGHCQGVFNALAHLIDETPGEPLQEITEAPSAVTAVVEAPTPTPPPETPVAEQSVSAIETELEALPESSSAPLDFLEEIPENGTDRGTIHREEPHIADLAPEGTTTPTEITADVPFIPADPILPRETTAIPGYSKWAETPLAGGGMLVSEPARRPRWPFVLASLMLFSLLLGQGAYRFRTDLALMTPVLGRAFTALGWNTPLPRKAELITIDASDLQSDGPRNLLILQATLKNRAAFNQALPSLELALTDTQDGIIARRVLGPEDYLTPGSEKDTTVPHPTSFTANGELALRLWIEAQDVTAAGYRLYVFYP